MNKKLDQGDGRSPGGRHGDRFMAPSVLCAQEGIWGLPHFRLVPGQPWFPGRKEGGPSRWPGYWQPGHNCMPSGDPPFLYISNEIFPNCGLGLLGIHHSGKICREWKMFRDEISETMQEQRKSTDYNMKRPTFWALPN